MTPRLGDLLWPVQFHQLLYHVGSLNPDEKGQHGRYEGHGLSVSTEPKAWVRIARLGDAPCWGLERIPPGIFLDHHRLTASHHQLIATWGLRQGWLRTATLYWPERDDDEWVTTFSYAYEHETDARLAMGLESDDPLTVRTGLACTPRLLERLGWSSSEAANGEIGGALLFASDVLQVDGMWWDDVLDVSCLSAPRGVIFPERLSAWQRIPETELDGHEDPGAIVTSQAFSSGV